MFEAECVPLLACVTCGSYGSARLFGLRSRCCGYKAKYGARALKHLAEGRLPKAKRGWRLRHVGSVASLQRKGDSTAEAG